MNYFCSTLIDMLLVLNTASAQIETIFFTSVYVTQSTEMNLMLQLKLQTYLVFSN